MFSHSTASEGLPRMTPAVEAAVWHVRLALRARVGRRVIANTVDGRNSEVNLVVGGAGRGRGPVPFTVHAAPAAQPLMQPLESRNRRRPRD
eukprot:5988186-Prymnesium_polylepis.1